MPQLMVSRTYGFADLWFRRLAASRQRRGGAGARLDLRPGAGLDVGSGRHPRAADRDDPGMREPLRGVSFTNAAGRAETNIRKRSAKRIQRREPAGGNGRKEFDEVIAARDTGDEIGGGLDAGHERQIAGSGRV